jgi:hypothetical protein
VPSFESEAPAESHYRASSLLLQASTLAEMGADWLQSAEEVSTFIASIVLKDFEDNCLQVLTVTWPFKDNEVLINNDISTSAFQNNAP